VTGALGSAIGVLASLLAFFLVLALVDRLAVLAAGDGTEG